jgi:hypothetical protein
LDVRHVDDNSSKNSPSSFKNLHSPSSYKKLRTPKSTKSTKSAKSAKSKKITRTLTKDERHRSKNQLYANKFIKKRLSPKNAGFKSSKAVVFKTDKIFAA